MAITIQQQPALHSAIGSKMIITATSTNIGNEGFMYAVEVFQPVGTTMFFVPQNANGWLIFDPTEAMKPFIRCSPNEDTYDPTRSIHAFAADVIGASEIPTTYKVSGYYPFTFVIKESWLIDGEMVVNDESEVNFQFGVYNANLSLQKGLNFDFLDLIGYRDGIDSLIMSDRLPSTHFWPEALQEGLADNSAIYIPVYESDWGVWSIRNTIDPDVDASKIRISLLPASGAPVQLIVSLTESDTYTNCGLYPANLNASTIAGIPKPQDYPNWKAIYFQVLNDAEEVISKSYVMYNAERYGKCLGEFEKVRLGWVGRRGGWEYINFTKESEHSIVTEKTIAQRAIGNNEQVGAGGTPFAFNSFDESEIVTDMKVDSYLTATTDWLSDGEFEFLKGLFMSKQVHWVQDDGSHIPVIVQGDGYEVKRNRANKQYQQTIKLKIAQEQFN